MTTALWSGRLPGGLDPDVKAFTASLAVDRRLLPVLRRLPLILVRCPNITKRGASAAATEVRERESGGLSTGAGERSPLRPVRSGHR